MTPVPHSKFWLSLLIGLLLQLIALPELLAAARPLWLPLLLVYWTLAEPRVPTLIAGFGLGICLDVLYNTIFGQHAIGLLILVYFMARLRGIFILLPLWQSTIALVPAWLGYCAMMALIDSMLRHQADPWLRWMPAVSSTLFWPMIHGLFHSLLRRKSDD